MADLDALNKDLMFIVLQFLAEEGFMDSAHSLERESGVYFNMRYFEDKVLGGEWGDVETYLSGFTRFDENKYSAKMYFEISKQKYLEALDRQDKKTAIDVLINELKLFEPVNEDLYKQITQLITLSNFRENEILSGYGDTRSTRQMTMRELRRLLQINPVFHDKLTFPDISSGRLTSMINQSFNWQHHLCGHPSPNDQDIRRFDIDHIFDPININDHDVCVPININLDLTLSSPAPVLDLARDPASDSALAPAQEDA